MNTMKKDMDTQLKELTDLVKALGKRKWLLNFGECLWIEYLLQLTILIDCFWALTLF
jgi:hypothetical protein